MSRMTGLGLVAAGVIPLLLAVAPPALSAQEGAPGGPALQEPARPAIDWIYPWKEDWSVLANPALRTDPFDPIKYIRIGSDPKSYLSFGATIRQRFESVSLRLTPLQPDDYLLDRMQVHADLHLGPHVQVFTQLLDARAFGKDFVAPIDQDRVDMEQAFVGVTFPVGRGALKITAGRQEPDLDMQRFASTGDGPNVPKPFDSFHIDYTDRAWRVVGFYSRPVAQRDGNPFDDVSSRGLTLSGVRVEWRDFGHGKLSLFAAQLRDDSASYVSATGRERRNILDLHYAGRWSGWDWDAEGMGQGGQVGAKRIRAWGLGGAIGHTWVSGRWSPRLGFQVDAASGTNDLNGDVAGTFNPLFPNGYYELLVGYPGYANFVHLKSSAMVFLTRALSALVSAGAVWRETTADAVYLLPAIPVAGTAGKGSAYSGAYAQLRLDWRLSAHLAGAIDAESFAHSRSLHQAGARDGHYIGIELKCRV